MAKALNAKRPAAGISAPGVNWQTASGLLKRLLGFDLVFVLTTIAETREFGRNQTSLWETDLGQELVLVRFGTKIVPQPRFVSGISRLIHVLLAFCTEQKTDQEVWLMPLSF